MTDRHGPREIQIFQQFAWATGLFLGEGSVEKRSPPEPDILYLSQDAGPLAFELVELIDQSFALRTSTQSKLKMTFERSYEALESHRKARVARAVGNALVHVVFSGEANFSAKKEAVHLLFEVLGDLDVDFKGELRHRDRIALPAAVDSIRISRLQAPGPFFDVDAVGSLGDPTLEAIRGKWAKTYGTSHPIQLLAYYERQPELPDRWRQRLKTFLDANCSSSPFRRVWVYDCGTESVRFLWEQQFEGS